MNEAPAISSYDTYNSRMELSMLDKLFFIDKINTELVVDFGCANGVLLDSIKDLKPQLQLIGYDNDPNVEKQTARGVSVTSNWLLIKHLVETCRRPTLVLSSVIHEVFHYGSKVDIDTFWTQVFESDFEYIVIRDMLPSRAVDRAACINDVKKIYHKFLGTQALDDFERVWGSIENNKQLVHFLLKYKYLTPNWEREVRENYLPVTREAMLAKIPANYDIIYHEHYILPYLLQTVKDDVGIELKDSTHLKLILKRH